MSCSWDLTCCHPLMTVPALFEQRAEKLVRAASFLLQAPECSCLCPSLASTVTARSTLPLVPSSLATWGFW